MPITAEEREFVRQYLVSSSQRLHAAVAGLSPEQWNFRPDGDWSPVLNIEHVYILEGARLEQIAHAAASDEIKLHRDRTMVRSVLDRSIKAIAPEQVVPRGGIADPGDVLRNFDVVRERTLAWLDNTADPRQYATFHPFFKMLDGYQWLLFFAAHLERHIAQIEELKARPDFPQSTNRAGSSVGG